MPNEFQGTKSSSYLTRPLCRLPIIANILCIIFFAAKGRSWVYYLLQKVRWLDAEPHELTESKAMASKVK